MTAMEKNNKTLNVPHLRFPEFSGEWEKELLGTTCNVLMCKRILASQTNAECGVPFYKIGTIGGVPDAYISKELFESYRAKYNYPRKGEVMITCAGTVGKAMIFDGEDSYYQDSNIVWIDNPANKIDNTFLYHFISKVEWSKLNTTTIVRIYNDDLRQLRISYPTLSEQRKISIFLNLLNQRIETQKKIIEDLKKLKDAICNLNVTSGSVLKLGNAGKFVRGLTYSASDVIEDTIGTAVMRSNNISNGDPVNFEELVWVNKTPNHEQILRSGDIVICMANGSSPLGRCHAAQLAIIKQMSVQVSGGSSGDYQADERAGVTRLSWRSSSRRSGRCHAAQLASIRQMSGQVSRGLAGDYQSDERAGVAS